MEQKILQLKKKRNLVIKMIKAEAFNKFLKCFDKRGRVKSPYSDFYSMCCSTESETYQFEEIIAEMKIAIKRTYDKYNLKEKQIKNDFKYNLK